MKREYIHEQRQLADRMEAYMIALSSFGIVMTVLVLVSDGWGIGLCAFFLSAIGYSISRLFHLFSELFGCLQELTRDVDSNHSQPPEKKS